MLLPDISHFWSLISIFAILQTFLPAELRGYFQQHYQSWWSRLCTRFNRATVVEVLEDLNDGFSLNAFYRQVEIYLGSLEQIHNANYLRVSLGFYTNRFSFGLPPNETIEDTYNGAQLLWTHHAAQKPALQQQQMGRRGSCSESRSFFLTMLKSDRALLSGYLNHISEVATNIQSRDTQRNLHTNAGQYWEQVKFDHPSTFDTLALSPELKERIKSDLKAFSEGEVYYHTAGRAWKRGYLLYGPPGTGKSSMIAAMANFLQYDIYELELTSVSENADLKALLIRTTRKSIIVIEDIDCSLNFSDRDANRKPERKLERTWVESKQSSNVTLSGLLNFTDGLWSCLGEERIFVFTTNHKERLDPALLRSGRMDFQILLSYCTFPAFKLLAANYLGVQEHEMFEELEQEMKNSRLTPAEVIELLISNKRKPEAAFHELIAALRTSNQQQSSVLPTIVDQLTLPLHNSIRQKKQCLTLKKITRSGFKSAVGAWSRSFKTFSTSLRTEP